MRKKNIPIIGNEVILVLSAKFMSINMGNQT
jgi:hypothetical protein